MFLETVIYAEIVGSEKKPCHDPIDFIDIQSLSNISPDNICVVFRFLQCRQ